MIIIALTSWVKRINNVKKVVESIMNNTILPDRVYLNLSKEEFEGINLPKDLEDYFNSDNRLIINWVDGPNTKSMKKIFPILQYLNDDDIIIDTDDDIIFPKDLIESRLKDFESYGKKYCITSNPHTSIGFGGKMKVVQATTLFQKKMLNNWEKFVTHKVVETYNDDRTYLHILWLNGYRNAGCTKYPIRELIEKFNIGPDDGMKKNNEFLVGKMYDFIVHKEFMERVGKNIIDCFGYYRNEDCHNCHC